MDERLLPIAEELFRVPAIESQAGAVGGDEQEVRPTLSPTLSTDRHRKAATLVLELSVPGTQVQEPRVEMLVRGPGSQVALLQAVGRLLASNDKASHQLVQGLLQKAGEGT
ncbi:MAG: hypothetical protein IT445_18295 [Phycisphaeraceae bacterium]|nr:hypothetical protein [Phycisphaeraceae bacterium]